MIKDKKTISDLIEKLKLCEHEEGFTKFIKEYWTYLENTICREKNIRLGDKRPIAETFERLRSNISYLLDGVSEMRRMYLLKLWWWLFL